MSDIRESDWKTLRSLHDAALDRYCRKVLDELIRVSTDSALTSHQRYLAIFKLIEKRDDELAEAFNGFRRSVAIWQLKLWKRHGLLTDEEYSRFSEETRERVDSSLKVFADPSTGDTHIRVSLGESNAGKGRRARTGTLIDKLGLERE
jgi:hypothetical protein